ncbi:MAG: hypothetical protein HXY41_10785 [Chloroflexi bacterium]|nr:hypothetical protein [Chloroflexota bacterium]
MVVALLGAGCSSLPGLRVLSGQTAPEAAAERVVEITGLVMADKTGQTDPSIISAADRIEAAAGGSIDIIEIRQDTQADVFNVYMLYRGLETEATAQEQNDALRRALELTWQGILQASQGSDIIRVNMLQPSIIPTLDKGLSFAARISATFDISRASVLVYLNKRPTTLQDFVSLIADGDMIFQSPQDGEAAFYDSQPNHPMFMLASIEAQLREQQ